MAVLAEPINALTDGYNNFVNGIGDFFTNIINSIGEWFNDLFSTLGEILSYLNPFHENFFLKLAFIPSEGYIPAKFDELKVEFDNRLPIIGTFTEIFDSITQVQSKSIRSTSPTFTMELPSKWGGQTVEVINFAPIDPYIPYIKTLIRILLWIPFIIKMYKRLPQVIY